jgi:flagellar basal-body rod protein FlgB
MFITNLAESGATPALVKTMAFNEARLQMIAENVANSTTPGYRTKQLDTNAFQHSLREALDRRSRAPHRPFVVQSGKEVATDDHGTLEVTPSLNPAENVLFHDGTNMSIERQMADLAETGMMHDLATTLLGGKFRALRAAIRGRVS